MQALERVLIDAAAAFIVDADPAGVRSMVALSERPRLLVRTWPTTATELVVGHAFHPRGGGWEPDIVDQIREVAIPRVEEKALKLARARVTAPRILALIDEFHFGRPHQYAEVLRHIVPARAFEAIFLIESPGIARPIFNQPAASSGGTAEDALPEPV